MMNAELEACYQEGFAAGADGKPYKNPYDVLSLKAQEYAEGFKDGKHERKQKLLKAIQSV